MKAGRNNPMETPKIRREIVAVMMESPLYFTIPLKRRLEFIIFFSQQPVYSHICKLDIAKDFKFTADRRCFCKRNAL
jgi:hypothetical protein